MGLTPEECLYEVGIVGFQAQKQIRSTPEVGVTYRLVPALSALKKVGVVARAEALQARRWQVEARADMADKARRHVSRVSQPFVLDGRAQPQRERDPG